MKKSKNLLSCNSFLRLPLELYAPSVTNPIGVAEIGGITNKTDATNTKQNTTQSANGFDGGDGSGGDGAGGGENNLTSMFSTFIENLAARLPDRNLVNTNSTETPTATNDATTQTNALISDCSKSTNSGNGKYMRPTSELLDDLQRALAITPTAGQTKGYVSIPKHEQRSATTTATTTMTTRTTTVTNEQQSKVDAVPPPKMFHVHIEIENALHLPTFAIPPNKKGAKRNRNTINPEQNKSSGSGGSDSTSSTSIAMELEPNTYVTFEATATNVPSSSTTYTTNIIETSCSPRWNKQFEVFLPTEYLRNVSVFI